MKQDIGDIDTEIQNLNEIREQKLKELKYIEYEIKKCKIKKFKVCKENGGHDFITEREDGIYGEIFTYCKNCNYNG